MPSLTVTDVLLIIGALTTSAVTIISLFRGNKTKAVVEQVAAETTVQTEKLDKITTLVDGTKSVLLRKIAYLLRVAADKSGHARDIEMANAAELEAAAQERRVAKAEAEANGE